MRLAILACVAAFLPWAAAADAPADARAAERLDAALKGLSSLRAEFRQTVTNAAGAADGIRRGHGRARAARASFAGTTATPPQLIVSDGTTVWLYDEDLAQVTVRPAAEALVGTPALLLSGQADLRAEFSVTDGGQVDGLAWSLLAPRDAQSDFRELRVGIADGELRRMILVDRLGQTTQPRFRSASSATRASTRRASASRRRRAST